jgi:hypothetical protein
MEQNKIQLCDYGCGQEAKFLFKNGKWCCSKSFNSCPKVKKNHSIYMKELRKDPNSIYHSKSYKENHSNGIKKVWNNINSIFNSDSYKKKRSNVMKKSHKDPNSKFNSLWKKKKSIAMKDIWKDPDSKLNSITRKEKVSFASKKVWDDPNGIFNSRSYKEKRKLNIKKIKEKYPFFSKVEELRYNPNTPLEEKEIQVHCKNHECKNSKEKGGWFTPTYIQLSERIKALENPRGFGEANFYCSQHCRDTCILFGLRSDPYKDTTPLPYTAAEKEVWRQVVLERENGLCEYCGEPAEHVHHIFPVKIEPFFALDPDYGVACCAKHHYKYAHKDECSTGNLAKIVCSVESQKFLNQKLVSNE